MSGGAFAGVEAILTDVASEWIQADRPQKKVEGPAVRPAYINFPALWALDGHNRTLLVKVESLKPNIEAARPLSSPPASPSGPRANYHHHATDYRIWQFGLGHRCIRHKTQNLGVRARRCAGQCSAARGCP